MEGAHDGIDGHLQAAPQHSASSVHRCSGFGRFWRRWSASAASKGSLCQHWTRQPRGCLTSRRYWVWCSRRRQVASPPVSPWLRRPQPSPLPKLCWPPLSQVLMYWSRPRLTCKQHSHSISHPPICSPCTYPIGDMMLARNTPRIILVHLVIFLGSQAMRPRADL